MGWLPSPCCNLCIFHSFLQQFRPDLNPRRSRLGHSRAYLVFLAIAKKLTCLKGNRHLPEASKYLSIKVNGSEMSLQMVMEGAGVWSGSAKSNEAETCSTKMTDANDALQKANSMF